MRKIRRARRKKQLTSQDICRRIGKLAFLLIFITLGALVVYGYRSGYFPQKIAAASHSFHQTMKRTGFVVDDVFIEGRVRTSMSDLQRVLSVEKGLPMTQVDMEQIFTDIKHLPWVKEVQLRRKLPNLLYVQLKEKTPIALWQKKGKHHLLDEDGHIIHASADDLGYLIVVVGNDAPAHTPQLIEALAQYPELTRRTMSAVRIGERRWNLILDHIKKGLVIALPEENMSAALKRLDSLNQEHQILNRQLSLIDLRLPDRLIVQTLDKKPVISFKKKEQ